MTLFTVIPSDKPSLRKHFRGWRRALDTTTQQKIAQNIRFRAMRGHWFRKAQSIAFYWPNDGEPDLLPLIYLAHKLGKDCFLPRLDGHTLNFCRYSPHKMLKPNQYGIPEPSLKGQIPTESLDVILLPLVAFDAIGNRLGMGGGYYDRCLTGLPKNGPRPKLFGVAHAQQKLQRGVLPIEAWDYPLDGCLTHKNMMFFGM